MADAEPTEPITDVDHISPTPDTNLQKIKDVICTSELSLAEQTELADLFTRAKNDEELAGIAKLVTQPTRPGHPRMIRLMSDNYQAKIAAFATGDSKLWQQILDKEKQMLAEYLRRNTSQDFRDIVQITE